VVTPLLEEPVTNRPNWTIARMPDYEARIKLLEAENEALRDRVWQLEEALGGAAVDFPLFLDLTSQESICLGVLLTTKCPRKATFMTALYGHLPNSEVEAKIVDVYICKVRKKLVAHGIAIETAWGQGYFLNEETKAKLRELMAAG
jgi:two-component system cell cycle response regulator CtrA